MLAEWVFGQGLSLILMIGVAALWIGSSFWAIRDVVRRNDMEGGAKAGWIVVGAIPLAGPLVYAVARPKEVTLDRLAEGRGDASQVSFETAEEITNLGKLLAQGEITNEEYERRRRLLLS